MYYRLLKKYIYRLPEYWKKIIITQSKSTLLYLLYIPWHYINHRLPVKSLCTYYSLLLALCRYTQQYWLFYHAYPEGEFAMYWASFKKNNSAGEARIKFVETPCCTKTSTNLVRQTRAERALWCDGTSALCFHITFGAGCKYGGFFLWPIRRAQPW